MIKPKIAIIRALDLRIIQAEYAKAFKQFEGIYVSNFQAEIAQFFKNKPQGWRELKLRAPYFFNPAKDHQAWLDFDPKALKQTLQPMDICQIQEPFFLYAGHVARLAKKLNKPLIAAPWMCFNHLSTYLPPYCFSVKQVMAGTSLFIMRTQRVNRYLDQFKIPDRKRTLVYHGINSDRFFPVKKKPTGKVRVLFCGVLHESKGINDLLAVWPQVIKTVGREKAELAVCGQGGEAEKVKAMGKILPIKFIGQVVNFKMPAVYQSADIFCGPSKDWFFLGLKRTEEGMGFVFLEAMASGLPVVTNDCGAIKEVVGKSNFINQQGDLKALKESLIMLIESEKLRQKIGQENRRLVLDKFDLAKQVAKEETMMRKLI